MNLFNKLGNFLLKLITSPFGYNFYDSSEDNSILDDILNTDEQDFKKSITPKESDINKSNHHYHTISILSNSEKGEFYHEDDKIRKTFFYRIKRGVSK